MQSWVSSIDGGPTTVRRAHGILAGILDVAVSDAVLVSHQVHVGSPKTHRSRSVPYPEFLSAQLQEATTGKAPDELLFDDDLDAVAAALDRAKRESDVVKMLSDAKDRES